MLILFLSIFSITFDKKSTPEKKDRGRNNDKKLLFVLRGFMLLVG